MLNGDCTRQEMVSRFMKRLAGHFANEHAVVTPNGKLLAADPHEGLARWKKLPAAERKHLDDLGKYKSDLDPAPPPGGLVLKVYARGLVRDHDGRLQIYRNPGAPLSKEAGRDHLWLTRTEAESLLPAQPRTGESRPLPESLVDRICRRYLIDLVRIGGEGGPYRPEDVLEEKLFLTVEAVTPGAIDLRLHGRARFRVHGPENGAPSREGRSTTFHLLGLLRYDRTEKAWSRFDLVALSETGHYDEIGKKIVPLGVAFERTAARIDTDRVRPHSLYDHYFDAPPARR